MQLKSYVIKLTLVSLLFISAIGLFSQQQKTSEIRSVNALAKRILNDRSQNSVFQLISSDEETDIFEVETVNNKTVIRGNSGISLSAGLNYYLKNYCNNSISWLGNNINLPAQFPIVSSKFSVSSHYIYRPYMNYCTLGYSTPFWDWKRWEKNWTGWL